jgi:hypothetical protein
MPSVHRTRGAQGATHVPPLQTPDGQLVPSAALPVSLQTGDPVLHAVTPTLHAFDGLQGASSLHVMQLPLLQTLPEAQVLPLAAFPDSRHCGAPVVQTIVPNLQAEASHGMFAAQATQAPSLQTMPFPQLFPFGAFPDSSQTDAPVLHEVFPVLQGFCTLHETPGVHETHAPLLQ